MTHRNATAIWPGRRVYATAAAAWMGCVVYGSLVPLRFASVPLDHAREQLLAILRAPVELQSRTDAAANVLLFIPLGFLVVAALRAGRRGTLGAAGATALAVCTAAILGGCVETAQIFFPSRVPSLSDLLAQVTGGAIGALLWVAAGERVDRWLHELRHARSQSSLMERLLLGYLACLTVAQLLPLDVTINPAQLAEKYREGRVILRPFAYPHPSLFDWFWTHAGDVLLHIPVGAAMVLAGAGSRAVDSRAQEGLARLRPAWLACVLGGAFVIGIEAAQLFVMSRVVAVTDVLTGTAGVVAGVLGAKMLMAGGQPAASPAMPRGAGAAAVVWRVLLAGWLAVLVMWHWWPLQFSAADDDVAAGMRQLLSAPFTGYYQSSEFHAMTGMMRKAFMAAPLGVLWCLAWPQLATSTPAIRTFAIVLPAMLFLGAVEVGQVFLPSRTPDLSDPLIGVAGVAAGAWLVGRLWMSDAGHERPRV